MILLFLVSTDPDSPSSGYRSVSDVRSFALIKQQSENNWLISSFSMSMTSPFLGSVNQLDVSFGDALHKLNAATVIGNL